MAREQPPSARLQSGLLSGTVGGAISRLSERSPLLAPRHLVATPALVAAPSSRAVTTSAALLEAARAIDWFVAAGLEGHLGLLAAARARGAEHFAFAATGGRVAAATTVGR